MSHEEINAYLLPYIEPLRHKSFHFSRKWLQGIAATAADIRSEQFAATFKTSRQLNLPPNYLMMFRVLGGLLGIAAQLDDHQLRRHRRQMGARVPRGPDGFGAVVPASLRLVERLAGQHV